MKAVIMAGGQGTRGRPYTEYFPKAMTPVSDKPLIDHIVRYVGSSDLVDQVIVVADLRGLGGQILNYYGADDPSYDHSKIAFVQDSQSGTGGDLLHVSDMIPDGEPFILWFSDNLCAVDLAGMYRQFADKGSAACIATRKRRAEETGFVVVDDGGTVLRFMEKPVVDLPSPECLGVYVLRHDVLSCISEAMEARAGGGKVDDDGGGGDGRNRLGDEKRQVNLSHDILEDLSRQGSVSAFDIGDADWVDVESPAMLERHGARIGGILSAMHAAAAGSNGGRDAAA